MIQALIFLWKRRDSPWSHLAVEYSLLTKMARRCAYDLDHAVAELPDGFLKGQLKDSPKRWLDIFSPDGVKNYRHQLYADIDSLEMRVEKLRNFCTENGLDPDEVDGMFSNLD